jgi:hypothetical protein
MVEEVLAIVTGGKSFAVYFNNILTNTVCEHLIFSTECKEFFPVMLLKRIEFPAIALIYPQPHHKLPRYPLSLPKSVL